MTSYQNALEVRAPAEQVWAVLLEVERWPQWTPSMTALQLLTPGPLAVGSKVRVQQPRLPALEWTVDELVPGTSFAWSSRSAGVTSRADHRVTPLPGGCRVEVSLVQAGPVAGLLALVHGRLTRRYLRQELEGLRRHTTAS